MGEPEVTREAVERWVEAYRLAWDSNRPQDVGALFADDARYVPEPSAEPWEGREAIVEGWLEHRDEPGDATFEFEVLGVDGDLAFVRGRTEYVRPEEVTYHNLWVIRLGPDGRASEFTEWWMPED